MSKGRVEGQGEARAQFLHGLRRGRWRGAAREEEVDALLREPHQDQVSRALGRNQQHQGPGALRKVGVCPHYAHGQAAGTSHCPRQAE
eukprot:scaffold112743_cov31-Prasinocladus_malaysianus.AAC.3